MSAFLVSLLLLLASSCSGDFNFQNESSVDDGKIVGGYPVFIHEYPHQVALELNGEFQCGGAILSETKILTAAHCILNTEPKLLKIRAGTSKRGVGGVLHNVLYYKIHPKYDVGLNDYDVGVITLKTPLKYSSTIQRVILSTIEPIPGTLCGVIGWGNLEENGSLANQLQAVLLPYISRKECQKEYSQWKEIVTDKMICAGFQKGGRGACYGDSGGPLLTLNGKQIGIVSWGKGCARPKAPDVYTNIGNPEILDFIFENFI